MGNDFRYIDENLERIRYNIAEACAKYRTADEKVRLMAVTKTVSVEAINHAVFQGVDLLGENRVQEYQSKCAGYNKSAEVQFIGSLQTNKVKYIINSVSMIQSVDSIRLAMEINRLAKANNKVMDILCEVNIGDEDSKGGIKAGDTYDFLSEIACLENIRVKGLMTIPPPWESDVHLGNMQELFENVKSKSIHGVDMEILSMGMSGDYAQAIRYGSTLVRIGSGLFGARNYNK
ncbi:MAG: YggS family pyridoxal phosphate-dependent enzyme [Ruminococcus sp.]|nr:YggS family pyridoxal phosphate-dependent enzyme [Ruminococcus sp.]